MTRQYLIIDIFLTLGLHLLLCAHARVVPAAISNKNCPSGCTDHGNCNGETGLCECRFGFGGPDCSRRLMPACHSTPDIASSIPGYGHWFPKNCFCHKQLMEAGCSRAAYREPFLCNYYQFWDWKNTLCYVLKGVPEDQQFSSPPDGPNDPRYQWKRGLFNQTLSEQSLDPFHFEDASPPEPYELPNKDILVPLEKCPDRCSGRGWCVTAAMKDAFSCRCHGFYMGAACETPRNEHCYLNCSGRGVCSGGFCHCQPSYWGLGCARSNAYVSDTWLPHPTKVKIYVYDLPEQIAYKKPWHDEPALLDTMYLAEVTFMDQLLSDWSVRTENPWEANLFVLNTYTIYYTGNIGFPAKHFANVFSYVRNHFPFWNMTGGRNHVAMATNDRGCCDIYKLARMNPDLQHPIKMVHFGQVGRFSRGHGSLDPATEAAFREFKRLAAHHAGGGAVGEEAVDGPDGDSTMALKDLPEEVVRFRGFPSYTLEAIRMEREPCFRPEQDVAIPNYLERGWLDHVRKAYGWDSNGRPVHNSTQRQYLFYFNGYSKSDMAYSGGVRQGLLAMYSNLSRPDVAINPGCCTAEYMLKSLFCLSPLGYGWGIRLTQAMHTGCVPVLVQDHVYTAFWDVLPYEKFSIRINRHNLHRLFDILDAITPEQLAELQQGLADYHRYFIWHGDAGGLAYNATITSLHRRLLNMWTALFRGST